MLQEFRSSCPMTIVVTSALTTCMYVRTFIHTYIRRHGATLGCPPLCMRSKAKLQSSTANASPPLPHRYNIIAGWVYRLVCVTLKVFGLFLTGSPGYPTTLRHPLHQERAHIPPPPPISLSRELSLKLFMPSNSFPSQVDCGFRYRCVHFSETFLTDFLCIFFLYSWSLSLLKIVIEWMKRILFIFCVRISEENSKWEMLTFVISVLSNYSSTLYLKLSRDGGRGERNIVSRIASCRRTNLTNDEIWMISIMVKFL